MTTTDGLSDLVEAAKRVLVDNRRGEGTCPAPDGPPHLETLDSAIAAIGLSCFDEVRARREILAPLRAQWKNGMVPTVVYDRGHLEETFPGPAFWAGRESAAYATGHQTSAACALPFQAIAVRRVFDRSADRDGAVPWLREAFGRLMHINEFLYRSRDFKGEGIVTIRHPWESSIDYSPVWHESLRCIDLEKNQVPEYDREPLSPDLPEAMRPTREYFDRCLLLITLFRALSHDELNLSRHCPFRVQDPGFNSVFCKANEDLIELGRRIGFSTAHPETRNRKTTEAIRGKLWNGERGRFEPYDQRLERHVDGDSPGSFLPLVCGAATEEQAREIVRRLEEVTGGGAPCLSIPTTTSLRRARSRGADRIPR